MMTVSLMKEPAICYLCSQSKLHEVARQFCEPGVMDAGGNWTDGRFTKEKSKKWGEALKKADEQLRSPCLMIWFDCESGLVCKSCVENMLVMFDKKPQNSEINHAT